MVWTAGGLLSGPIRWTRGARSVSLSDVALPILAGVALYGGFAAAKLVADQVPLSSHSVDSVLARADAGPRVLALVVALVNGVGEEVLFRGALHDAFDHYRSLCAMAIYGIVTIATLNVALVAAAVVMGSVFALERRASGGILAPILTHLSWSIRYCFSSHGDVTARRPPAGTVGCGGREAIASGPQEWKGDPDVATNDATSLWVAMGRLHRTERARAVVSARRGRLTPCGAIGSVPDSRAGRRTPG